MRTESFLTVLMVTVATTWATPVSYVNSPIRSRAYVLEYSRVQCEQNAAKPRKPYRATFDKALSGDFPALHTVFTDESYHTNDIEWNLIPWHILQVIGDSRYADFVLSRPSGERSTLLDLQSPYLVPAQEAAFKAFFRKHFPRTYALWAGFGIVNQYPEPNRFDYGVRRLSEVLAVEPRFQNVRVYKRLNQTILITASKSLSKRDAAELRVLVKTHLGNNAKLVFR